MRNKIKKTNLTEIKKKWDQNKPGWDHTQLNWHKYKTS